MGKNSNITNLIVDIEQQLLTIYDDPVLCEQYAWWTIQAITQLSKTALVTQNNISLSQDQQAQLDDWLEKLITQQMPIAYLIGSVPFCDVDILVEPPTLIPRPETEEWCSDLINQLKTLHDKKITILDLCCGTGCIAIALACALPEAQIYASDISESAIALTQKNIAHNKLDNITVIKSDLFENLNINTQYDIIVSNPPYIAHSEWKTLNESVTRWEDKNALLADDDGLAIIKKIIMQSPAYIKDNKELAQKNIAQVIIEIDYSQGPIMRAYMRQHYYTDARIKKDLEGKDRIIMGRTPFDHDPSTNSGRTGERGE